MTNTPSLKNSHYFPIRFGAQLREHVRALRKDAGLTQTQLGQRLGVGQARIAEIESNAAAISVEQLLRLLSVLGAELAIAAAEPQPVEASAPPPGKKAAPAKLPRTVRARKLGGGSHPESADGPRDSKRLRELNPTADVSVTSGRNFILRPKKGSW